MEAAKTVGIVWASKGGLGDVGKIVAMLALKEKVQIKAVALSKDGKDGLDGTEVVPVERREKLLEALKGLEVAKIDITEDSAEDQLAELFKGCSAVVACPGSRQSGISTTCAIGSKKVIAAMKREGG